MKKKLCFFLIIIFMALFGFTGSTSTKESFEYLAMTHGKNRWFIYDRSKDSWLVDRESKGYKDKEYIQITDGVYYENSRGYEDVLVVFFILEPGRLGCTVLFNYFAPYLGYEKFKTYSRSPINKDVEVSSTSYTSNHQDFGSDHFSFQTGDIQYNLVKPEIRKTILEGGFSEDSINLLTCKSDKDYLEVYAKGEEWSLKTRLYGPSPQK